jgi:hypothetical protein
MDASVKNNYFTQPDRRPPKSADNGEVDDVLKAYGTTEFPYVHTADICGVKIQLRTNSKHVHDFWRLNWFAAEEDGEPDGVIYVVKDVEGYEPHLYYDLKGRRILIVNCEYYGAAKSAGALGLAGVVLEEKGGYPIHGACVGIPKANIHEGVVIIAPTGTGKTSQFHELIYNIPEAKVHSDDYIFVFFKPEPTAYATENWLYMRTEIAINHPIFSRLFHNLPLENVVTEKEKCAQKSDDPKKMGSCYKAVLEGKRKCVFDRGSDRCYWSYANSRAMFPRYKFPTITKDEDGSLIEVQKEEENVINQAVVKYVLILTRDKTKKPVKLLNCNEVIQILKEGKFIVRPGAGPPEKWGQLGYEQFYNPYPPELNQEAQEKFFRKLYNSGVKFYMLNTGKYDEKKITIHQTHMYVRHIIEI